VTSPWPWFKVPPRGSYQTHGGAVGTEHAGRQRTAGIRMTAPHPGESGQILS
jgi:hypothetical protein